MKRVKKKTAKPVKRRASEGGKLAFIGTTGAKPAKAAKVARAVGRNREDVPEAPAAKPKPAAAELEAADAGEEAG